MRSFRCSATATAKIGTAKTPNVNIASVINYFLVSDLVQIGLLVFFAKPNFNSSLFFHFVPSCSLGNSIIFCIYQGSPNSTFRNLMQSFRSSFLKHYLRCPSLVKSRFGTASYYRLYPVGQINNKLVHNRPPVL